MRTWIMIAMLLVPGWGWAGEPSATINERDEYDYAVATSVGVLADKKVILELLEEAKAQGAELNVALMEYDEQHEVWNRARPSSCESKMQAAMEAMEPFVVIDPTSNIMVVDKHGNYVLASDSYWSGIASEAAPRRVAALKQWQTVKQECFK